MIIHNVNSTVIDNSEIWLSFIGFENDHEM